MYESQHLMWTSEEVNSFFSKRFLVFILRIRLANLQLSKLQQPHRLEIYECFIRVEARKILGLNAQVDLSHLQQRRGAKQREQKQSRPQLYNNHKQSFMIKIIFYFIWNFAFFVILKYKIIQSKLTLFFF